MIALPGAGAIRCSGPGEEITPRPIASIKSAIPKTFQARITARALRPCRCASHATGAAAIPVMMLPHAPACEGRERRRQTTVHVEQHEQDAQHAHAVDADQERQRNGVERLLERSIAGGVARGAVGSDGLASRTDTVPIKGPAG